MTLLSALAVNLCMPRPRTSTSSPTCAQVIEPLRVGAWDAVGVSEGNDVGAADGGAVGAGTGTFDGIGVVGRGLGAGVVGADVAHCDFGVGLNVGANVGFGTGTDVGFGAGTGVGTLRRRPRLERRRDRGRTVGTLLGGVVGTPVGMPVRWYVGLYEGAGVALGVSVGLDVGTRVGAATVGLNDGASNLTPAAPTSGAYSHAVYPALRTCTFVQPAASTARSAYLSFQAASPDLMVVHVPAAAPYFRLQLVAQFPPTAE